MRAMTFSTKSAVALAAGAGLASSALAGLSQFSTPTPGVMAQAVAGPSTTGGSSGPGADLSIGYHPGADIQEAAVSGPGAFASRSASHASAIPSGSISNAAAAQVGMGWGKFQATNNAPNSSFFAEANAGGGWKDRFLISDASKTGQSGLMVFTVNVSGALAASGFAGRALFAVAAFKDNDQLMINALWSPGNSDLLSTDRQYGHWTVASAPDAQKNVLDVVTFAVPFTYGTSFTLGVFGRAAAGMRSSSGVEGSSQASVQFQNTLTWGGVSRVVVGGNDVTGYTLSAESGTDWSGAIVPAPGAGVLALGGLVAGLRRRR
jgi:hypothetical protein